MPDNISVPSWERHLARVGTREGADFALSGLVKLIGTYSQDVALGCPSLPGWVGLNQVRHVTGVVRTAAGFTGNRHEGASSVVFPKYLTVCREGFRLPRGDERRAYPQWSVRSEQRSGRRKELRPFGLRLKCPSGRTTRRPPRQTNDSGIASRVSPRPM